MDHVSLYEHSFVLFTIWQIKADTSVAFHVKQITHIQGKLIFAKVANYGDRIHVQPYHIVSISLGHPRWVHHGSALPIWLMVREMRANDLNTCLSQCICADSQKYTRLSPKPNSNKHGKSSLIQLGEDYAEPTDMNMCDVIFKHQQWMCWPNIVQDPWAEGNT